MRDRKAVIALPESAYQPTKQGYSGRLIVIRENWITSLDFRYLYEISKVTWLHTPINFSIGYNAKKSKVSHLLQFYGPKSDPGYDGM